MDGSIRASELLVQILIIQTLPQRLAGRMVCLKLLIVRQQTIEIPPLIAKLSPIVQILARRHAEHIIIDGGAAAEHLSPDPAVHSAERTFLAENQRSSASATQPYTHLWHRLIIPIILLLPPELGKQIRPIDEDIVQAIAARFQHRNAHTRILSQAGSEDEACSAAADDNVVWLVLVEITEWRELRVVVLEVE